MASENLENSKFGSEQSVNEETRQAEKAIAAILKFCILSLFEAVEFRLAPLKTMANFQWGQ